MSGTGVGAPRDAFARRPESGRLPSSWLPFFRRSRSLASRGYLLSMFFLVLLSTGLVAYAFTRAALPPGVDPGHWLAISYTYVGLPTAPDPTDRVFFYAPLMFPFLGGLVLLTGSPPVAVDILAIGLLAGYGLTTILLARRYLASGPLQVALVGLAVFSGSTMQMLFWGGYPNLLGFVLINVAMVQLLRYARSRSNRDGALLVGVVGLTYFGHDLSFAVLVAVLGTSALFLLLLRKVPLSFLYQRATVLGLVALGVVIVTYSTVTAQLGIHHPSYFASNPAAYFIDEVGELFAPLAHAPAFLPPGPPVYLPPLPLAALLAASPLLLLGGLRAVQRYAPSRIDTRLAIAAAWFGATLAVPGAGYLVHIDTDYARFLYFIPLPFVLLLLAVLERAALPQLAPRLADLAAAGPAPVAVPAVVGAAAPGVRRRRPESRGPMVARGLVAVSLTMVFVLVTVPVVVRNEVSSTGTAHDQAFLDVVDWLRTNPHPGGVITVQPTARWTEALALRDAMTVGPVWLLFDPFQIADTQETYWALVSQYAVTNNQVALSYSGFATPVMSQAPMYTAYYEGVPFPVLRVLPGNLYLNATGPQGTQNYPVVGTTPPSLAAPVPNGTSVTVTYQNVVATVVETGRVLADGSAMVAFVVTPNAGVTVHSLGVTLAPPPSDSTTLATDTVTGLSLSGNTLSWTVTGKLGQYPTQVSIPTVATFSEPPVAGTAVSVGADSVPLVFSDANGSGRFGVSIRLVSSGASNPTGSLPSALVATDFFDAYNLRFLLWPVTGHGPVEIAYYTATFGFKPVFQNSEWEVLER